MKRTGKIVLLAAAMLSLLLTTSVNAASKKSVFNSALNNYKKGSIAAAQRGFNKLPKNAKEKYKKTMSKKMKAAFKKTVASKDRIKKGFITTYMLHGYYLADLDSDKKPELLIRYGSCEADMALYIYKFNGKTAKQVAKLPAAHSMYSQNPCGFGVYVQKQHMGYEEVFKLSLKNGKAVSTLIKSRTAGYGGSQYITFPYQMGTHVGWNSSYTKRTVDYSVFN